MMEELIIKNFKCFQDIRIPLNKLTIFAGGNANGKSTAIQAILFLRRTIEHCAIWTDDSEDTNYHFKKSNGLAVELNGTYGLSLGTSSTVLSFLTDAITIELGLKINGNALDVCYDLPTEEALWLKPGHVVNNLEEGNYILKQEFYYLNAERIGPRVNNPIQFYDFPNTGFDGSLCAQILGDTSFSYSHKVEEARRFKGLSNARILPQVNKWLDYILPGNEVDAIYDSKLMASQIRMKNHYSKGESVLATNIGFGLSYVLPIIVTALIAKKESLFIVENPEAHLHPSAQSKIGEFLAIIANSGVKIMVETHSDHVLNGLQIAVAKKKIPSEDIIINYFSQSPESKQPEVVPIQMSEKGELSSWPVGFFDQSQRDYASLLKLRKND